MTLDTVSVEAPVAEASATISVTPREVWRRARVPVVLGLMLVLLAVVAAVTTGDVKGGYLDPDAATKQGSLALATLLRDHGVEVRVVEQARGGGDTTVFVPVPTLLTNTSMPRFTDIVVVGPEGGVLADLAPDVTVRAAREPDTLDPSCEQADAVAAGAVLLGGARFSLPEDAVGCYAIGGRATFAEVVRDNRRVTLFGAGDLMTNEHLDEDGNAALALRVLTRHPTLEWVYPRALPEAGVGEDVNLLIPHNVRVFEAELFVVALLLALWRARRLGPVVAEPLPVVVRAAETIEGRARLYQAARARDRAALALRAGMRDRLVRTLGLARDASRESLVAAVCARTGDDSVDVDDVLYGPPPPDDEELIRLADDLDDLYDEVRDL